MPEHIFELKEPQTFIPLNKLLQILGIAQTGGHAKIIIKNEEITINHVVETAIRKKLVSGDIVIHGSLKILIK